MRLFFASFIWAPFLAYEFIAWHYNGGVFGLLTALCAIYLVYTSFNVVSKYVDRAITFFVF